jgi:hypothetical protein
MKKIFYCLFCLIFSSTVWADETDWKNGYILQSKDTIYGEIAYEAVAKPNTFLFKPKENNAPIQTFNALNCIGFGIMEGKGKNWQHFRAFKTNLEVSEMSLGEISSEKQPKFESQTLFLRAFCVGTKASLWLYKAKNKTHLFLQKENDTPMELVKKQYYTDNTKAQLADNNMYRQQLLVALSACKNSVDWSSIPYLEDNISTLIANYNQCQQGSILYTALSETKKYLRGYVLKNNLKDTVFCEIEDKNTWQTTPAKVEIRLQGAVQYLTTENTVGFGVQMSRGEWYHYQTHNINLEISETDLNKISTEKQPKFASKTLLLQAISTGRKAALWSYTTDVRVHFFLQKGNDTPIELVKKQYYADNTKKQLGDNNMYRQQLSASFMDCQMNENWAGISYNEDKIAAVVMAYNNCGATKTTEPEYQIKKESIKSRWGLIAGGGIATLNISDGLYTLALPLSATWLAGGSLDLILPRTNEHWSIYNDLSVSNYHFTKTYSDNLNNADSKTTIIDISATYLRLNTMARYTFAKPKVYLGLGFTNSIATTLYQTFTEQVLSNTGQVVSKEGPLLEYIRIYEQGIASDIGYQLTKNIAINARIQLSNGFSPFDNVLTRLDCYYLMGSYTF